MPMRHWLQGEARDLLEDLTSPVTIASRGLFNPDAVTAFKIGFSGEPGRCCLYSISNYGDRIMVSVIGKRGDSSFLK